MFSEGSVSRFEAFDAGEQPSRVPVKTVATTTSTVPQNRVFTLRSFPHKRAKRNLDSRQITQQKRHQDGDASYEPKGRYSALLAGASSPGFRMPLST